MLLCRGPLKAIALVSFVMGFYYFPRLVLGPLPPSVCAGLTLFSITGEFFITATINEIFFFRILLAFIWKNVGLLDDFFIMRFLLVANSLLAGHFAAGHYLVDSYKKPSYIICVGANPNKFEETTMPVKVIVEGSRYIDFAESYHDFSSCRTYPIIRQNYSISGPTMGTNSLTSISVTVCHRTVDAMLRILHLLSEPQRKG